MKQINTLFLRETPSKAEQKPPFRPKPGYCFQCGENGHVALVCENNPNPSLVTEKRKQLKERQALWDHQYGSNAPDALNAIHQKYNSPGIPKGLIGTKCTAQVNIEGNPCPCLLDTGSQVMTISQFFYEQNLSGLNITSLNNLLDVEAANEQVVPYLGYVKVRVVFPKDFFGSDVEVSTLALVVPETGGIAQPKVLIGTDTLDLAYD